MPSDFSDLYKLLQEPINTNLATLAKYSGERVQRAFTSGGERACNTELFAQCVAFGALFKHMSDMLCAGAPEQRAVLEEFAADHARKCLEASVASQQTIKIERG